MPVSCGVVHGIETAVLLGCLLVASLQVVVLHVCRPGNCVLTVLHLHARTHTVPGDVVCILLHCSPLTGDVL